MKKTIISLGLIVFMVFGLSASVNAAVTFTSVVDDIFVEGEEYTFTTTSGGQYDSLDLQTTMVRFEIEVVEKPEGSDPKMLLVDDNGNEHNIVKEGWGPLGGFPLGYLFLSGSDTVEGKLILDMAGDYEFKLNLVNVTNRNAKTIIQSETFGGTAITAEEKAQLDKEAEEKAAAEKEAAEKAEAERIAAEKAEAERIAAEKAAAEKAEAERIATEKAAADKAAADKVSLLISNLPMVSNLLASNKTDIDAAKLEYDKLTEEQQKLVENYSKLTDLAREIEKVFNVVIELEESTSYTIPTGTESLIVKSSEIIEGKDTPLYTWSFASLTIDKDFDMDFGITSVPTTEVKAEVEKFAENPVYLHFNFHGELPGEATIKYYVGDTYKSGEKVTLYYYNSDKKEIEVISKDLVVDNDGYITCKITHCSDYFFASTLKNNNNQIITEAEDTTQNNNSSKNIDNPKTSDNTPVVLLISVIILSSIALAITIKKLYSAR